MKYDDWTTDRRIGWKGESRYNAFSPENLRWTKLFYAVLSFILHIISILMNNLEWIYYTQKLSDWKKDKCFLWSICLKIVPPLLMTMKVFLSETGTGSKQLIILSELSLDTFSGKKQLKHNIEGAIMNHNFFNIQYIVLSEFHKTLWNIVNYIFWNRLSFADQWRLRPA